MRRVLIIMGGLAAAILPLAGGALLFLHSGPGRNIAASIIEDRVAALFGGDASIRATVRPH